MLSGTMASAQEESTDSANYVMVGCRLYDSGVFDQASRPAFLEGLCLGLTKGVMLTAEITGAICPPEAITNGQIVKIVVQYIDARADQMHESFVHLALDALTWPCKQ
jgi:hypothetical protein